MQEGTNLCLGIFLYNLNKNDIYILKLVNLESSVILIKTCFVEKIV